VRFLRLSTYFNYYSRVGKDPKFWHILLLLPRIVAIPKRGNFSIFNRFYRANRLSNDLIWTRAELPEIEALFVVAGKDLDILPESIAQVLLTSLNPIKCISIIVPEKDLENCKVKLIDISKNENIKIISEDKYLSDSFRLKIKRTFGARYGWVLQQLLTVEFVYKSKSQGVLMVNADTMILRNIQWVDSLGNQVLMASNEFHKPYYKLLCDIGLIEKDPNYTFVTHHMLFQPQLLHAVLDQLQVKNLEAFFDLVLDHVDTKILSPLCIEFELYAQGILRFFPTQVLMRKFANIGMKRLSGNLEIADQIKKLKKEGDYNSVSMHSYLI